MNKFGEIEVYGIRLDSSGDVKCYDPNQSIMFPKLDVKLVGEPDFDLAAKASSDLPVTYTSSNPSVASVKRSRVTIHAVGTTKFTAEQAGDEIWSRATAIQVLTIAPYPDLQKKSLEELLSNLDAVPTEIRTTVRNNAGGHANHSHLWKTLSNPGKKPEGKLAKEIDDTFGNYEKWKEEMTKTAMGVFGSGWAWFARNKEGKLFIKAYPNQDSPLMESATLIYGIDVWEHAYYLKHQNRRADYVKTSLEIAIFPK